MRETHVAYKLLILNGLFLIGRSGRQRGWERMGLGRFLFGLTCLEGLFKQEGCEAGHGATVLSGQLPEFVLHLFRDPAAQNHFIFRIVRHNAVIVHNREMSVNNKKVLILAWYQGGLCAERVNGCRQGS